MRVLDHHRFVRVLSRDDDDQEHPRSKNTPFVPPALHRKKESALAHRAQHRIPISISKSQRVFENNKKKKKRSP